MGAARRSRKSEARTPKSEGEKREGEEILCRLRRNASVPRFLFTHFHKYGLVSDFRHSPSAFICVICGQPPLRPSRPWREVKVWIGFGFRVSDFRLRRAAAFAS